MFNVCRLTGSAPSFSPTASPRVRRRLSPWPSSCQFNRGRRSPSSSPTRARAVARPISTRFEPVLSLRGFHHWFVRTYTIPVSLAGPGSSGSADPSRRCQGCSHPSLRFQGRAALSFSGLLRQAAGGSLQPTRITRRFMAARTAGSTDSRPSSRRYPRSTTARTTGRCQPAGCRGRPTRRPARDSRPRRGGTYAPRRCGPA